MSDPVTRAEFERTQQNVDSIFETMGKISKSVTRLEEGLKHILEHIEAQDIRNGQQNDRIESLTRQIIQWKTAIAVILGVPSVGYLILRISQAISIS